MTWENLQQEVLEQFADPRWAGMHLASLPAGVDNVSDGAVWKVVARKTDDGFRAQVLDVADQKYIWKAQELAEAIGDNTRSGAVLCGHALTGAEGWYVIYHPGKRWVNGTKLLAWFDGRMDVKLSDAQNETGVHVKTIGKLIRANGWKSRTTKDGERWRKVV